MRVDVATPNMPVPPFDTSRLLEDGCEVVARPPQVIVPVVVIVPPLIGHVVPIEETDAFEVLQVVQVRVSVPPRENVPPPPSGELVVMVPSAPVM